MRTISSCWLYPCPLCTHCPSLLQLNGLMKCSDYDNLGGSPPPTSWEVHWTLSFTGRRSSNMVFVGRRSSNMVFIDAPAEGSLLWPLNKKDCEHIFYVVGLQPGWGSRALSRGGGTTTEPTPPWCQGTLILPCGAVGLPSAPCTAMLS